MASSSIFDCDMDALNQDFPNFDDPKAEGGCQTEDEDEGSANVAKVLLESLPADAKELIATTKNIRRVGQAERPGRHHGMPLLSVPAVQ